MIDLIKRVEDLGAEVSDLKEQLRKNTLVMEESRQLKGKLNKLTSELDYMKKVYPLEVQERVKLMQEQSDIIDFLKKDNYNVHVKFKSVSIDNKEMLSLLEETNKNICNVLGITCMDDSDRCSNPCECF